MQVEARDRAARALPVAVRARDEHDGPPVTLDEPRGDDADHALVPVLAGEHVAALGAPRLRPGLDLRDGRAQDPVLDGLPVAVELLETLREAAGLVRVVGEQQLERRLGPAKTPGSVDPRRQPEGDRAFVDGGRVDARRFASARRCRVAAASASRLSPAIASTRFSSTSGTTSAIVASATRSRWLSRSGAAERLRELVDDAGAAELRERVVGRAAWRRSDSPGSDVRRPVVVGDDHLKAEPLGLVDLVGRGDTAVDGEDEAVALFGDALQRRAGEAVALLEPARQVPADFRAELAQAGTASAVAQIPSTS